MKKKAESDILKARISTLIETLAEGSQRAFAEMVGCSQAAVSKALSTPSPPGKHLLAMIAKVPGVNAQWLRTGEGSPLMGATTPTTEIPIARVLLAGPPSAYPAMLTSRSISLGRRPVSQGCYAIEARLALPASADPREQMRPDDILVIDTDTSTWLEGHVHLEGRLCVVRQGPRLVMRRLSTQSPSSVLDEQSAPLRALDFDPAPCDAEQPPAPVARCSFGQLRQPEVPPKVEATPSQVPPALGLLVQLIREY